MTGGALARTLLDFFLPVACLGCGSRLPLDRPREIVCVNCVGRLRPAPSPRCPRCDFPLGTARPDSRPCSECDTWPDFVRGARCAVTLEPPASTLVHALKYEGWKELSVLMGGRVASLVKTLPEGPQRPGRDAPERGARIVVPVPTTARRERHRGYNQAHLLAEVVAARNGLPLVSALARGGEGRTQVSLHAGERLANVRKAFSIQAASASRLAGASVVLVDDVLTTGATAVAAAYALHSGGVGAVSILTFGRALPGRDPRARSEG